MKALVEKFQPAQSKSFNIRETKLDFGDPFLHSHDTYELVLIMECSGKRFLGDSIEDFEGDEIAFMGPNLPHCWHINNGSLHSIPSAIVIHFTSFFFKSLATNFPEFRTLAKLSRYANQGIIFKPKISKEYRSRFIAISRSQEPTQKFIKLLELFINLTNEDFVLMASYGYSLKSNKADFEKINKIYEYVYSNYQQNISLEELAKIVHLSKTSFCRYFKQKTQKSLFTLLKEIRISQAWKLLIESEKTISQICYDTGFNTLANFNKQFKEITGLNPQAYRLKYNP